MSMSYEGFEAYSPEAQGLYVSLTSYRELYEPRKRPVVPGNHISENFRAIAYQNIISSALGIYRRDTGSNPFTAEQILEAALLTLRMDEATAQENKANGGEYTL